MKVKTKIQLGFATPRPVEPPGEDEIRSSWNRDDVVVSVLCPTFQHVDYVADALNSVLNQTTSFGFELLVRDDGSSDGTAEIVESFRCRYPRIISTFLEPINTWQDRKALGELWPRARGRYIAICEGDDYWLDRYKLERQVSILEGSPGLVLTHHQSLVDARGYVVSLEKLPRDCCVPCTSEELSRGAMALTNSLLFRNVDPPPMEWTHRIVNGDILLRSWLGQHGGSSFISDLAPSVYRLHAGGIWSASSEADKLSTESASLRRIGEMYGTLGLDALSEYFERRALLAEEASSEAQTRKGSLGTLVRSRLLHVSPGTYAFALRARDRLSNYGVRGEAG